MKIFYGKYVSLRFYVWCAQNDKNTLCKKSPNWGGVFPLGDFCLGDRKNNWGDFEKNGIYPFLYNLSLDNVFTALLVSVLKTFGSNRLYLLLTLFFYTTVYRCWLRKKTSFRDVYGKNKKRRNRKFPSLYLFNIENNAKTQKMAENHLPTSTTPISRWGIEITPEIPALEKSPPPIFEQKKVGLASDSDRRWKKFGFSDLSEIELRIVGSGYPSGLPPAKMSAIP